MKCFCILLLCMSVQKKWHLFKIFHQQLQCAVVYVYSFELLNRYFQCALFFTRKITREIRSMISSFVCFFFRSLRVCMCFGFLILLSIKHTKDRWQRTHVCCRCIKSFEILLWLSCVVRVLSFRSSVTVSHTKYILVERARNNATCTDLTANVSKTRWVFSVWCARVRACVCGKHEFIFLTY